MVYPSPVTAYEFVVRWHWITPPTVVLGCVGAETRGALRRACLTPTSKQHIMGSYGPSPIARDIHLGWCTAFASTRAMVSARLASTTSGWVPWRCGVRASAASWRSRASARRSRAGDRGGVPGASFLAADRGGVRELGAAVRHVPRPAPPDRAGRAGGD